MMFALGLIVLLVLGLSSRRAIERVTHRRNALNSAQKIRDVLTRELNNPASWRSTITALENPAMRCLATSGDCSLRKENGADKHHFALLDAGGNIFYDARNPQAGFTQNAEPCEAFPSSNCPYQMNLTWEPICSQAGSCINPQVEIRGVLQFDSPNKEQKVAFDPIANGIFLTLGQVQVKQPESSLSASPSFSKANQIPFESRRAEPSQAALVGESAGSPAEQIATAKKICSELASSPNALAEMKKQMQAQGASEELLRSLDQYQERCQLLK